MERFSSLLACCVGNSPVIGEFPSQRSVTRSFDVFFDVRLNERLNKQSWCWWFETPSCPLWRHSSLSATLSVAVIPTPWSTCLLFSHGFFLCMRPANEGRHYIVMSSLAGWTHTQNDPCSLFQEVGQLRLSPVPGSQHILQRFYLFLYWPGKTLEDLSNNSGGRYRNGIVLNLCRPKALMKIIVFWLNATEVCYQRSN